MNTQNLLISLNKNNKRSRLSSYSHLPNKSDQMIDTTRNEKSISLIIGDEEISDLKCQLIAQSSIIREYESWVHLLLNLVQRKNDVENHHDCVTPIQKGLEKIQQMEKEHIELKKKLLKQINLNTVNTSKYENKKTEYESMSTEIKDCNKDKLIKEKEQLLANIQSVGEELDDISKKNKRLQRASQLEDFQETYQLYKELLSLQEENSTLHSLSKIKKELDIKNRGGRKSYILLDIEEEQNKQKYRCLSTKNFSSGNSNSGRYFLNI